MRIFRTADPTRRTPTWLQARTKENFVWQLKVSAIGMLLLLAYDWWTTRRYDQEIERKLAELNDN